MAMLKSVKTAVALTAPAHIESHAMESALRAAQYSLDRKLHDLRNSYHAQEVKLRDEYLEIVREIASGAEDAP